MNVKRLVCLLACAVLGVLVGVGLHAAIEMLYLDWAVRSAAAVTWYSTIGPGPCALPPWLQIGLPVAGAIAGLFVGRVGWRWGGGCVLGGLWYTVNL